MLKQAVSARLSKDSRNALKALIWRAGVGAPFPRVVANKAAFERC
jgi:hypothetical protein